MSFDLNLLGKKYATQKTETKLCNNVLFLLELSFRLPFFWSELLTQLIMKQIICMHIFLNFTCADQMVGVGLTVGDTGRISLLIPVGTAVIPEARPDIAVHFQRRCVLLHGSFFSSCFNGIFWCLLCISWSLFHVSVTQDSFWWGTVCCQSLNGLAGASYNKHQSC